MDRNVYLLLTELNGGVQHYSSIRDFSRLEEHNIQKKAFYTLLLVFMPSWLCVPKKGERARSDCKTLKPQRLSYPQGDDTTLKFTNIQKTT